MTSNIPILTQSEEERAPWNEKTRTIAVTVSQTLSATVEIEVPESMKSYDYNVIEDYVKEQIILPSETISKHSPDYWDVDDFCVCL